MHPRLSTALRTARQANSINAHTPGCPSAWRHFLSPRTPPPAPAHSVCFMRHYFQEASDPSQRLPAPSPHPCPHSSCHSVCTSVPLVGEPLEGRAMPGSPSMECWTCPWAAGGKGVWESRTAWVKVQWEILRGARGPAFIRHHSVPDTMLYAFTHDSFTPHSGSGRRVGYDFHSTGVETEPQDEGRRSGQSHHVGEQRVWGNICLCLPPNPNLASLCIVGFSWVL